jgi:hypothetical protein
MPAVGSPAPVAVGGDRNDLIGALSNDQSRAHSGQDTGQSHEFARPFMQLDAAVSQISGRHSVLLKQMQKRDRMALQDRGMREKFGQQLLLRYRRLAIFQIDPLLARPGLVNAM